MAKFKKCPRCGGTLLPTKALAGNDSKFWKECSNSFCGTLVDTFEPYGMQYNFLADPHIYKGAFGGFGSGKSLAVIKDDEKHALITPQGHIGIIGFTYRQIKRNFKKDFEEDFPVALMKVERNQKTPGFNAGDMIYTLKNGCKIELITADNIVKLRGLNATKITILEASNVGFKIFDSLKSRLRNDAAQIFKTDEKGNVMYRIDEKTGEEVPIILHEWHSMNLESNPDGNWINKDFLLCADRVQFYGNSYNKYAYRLKNLNKDYSLHISATDANPYLPNNYLDVNTRGKPEWEVKRFYYGSFLFSENMIYPMVSTVIVDPYPIDLTDPDIFVIVGYDYGLVNISAFVFVAVNFRTSTLVVYDSLGVREMSVKEIAVPYREKLAVIPDGKLLMVPKMDAKSYSKRGADKQSVGSLFEDIGLLFDPIQEGKDVRIMKVTSLIKTKQLQIFRTNVELCDEITGYKKIVNSKGEVTDKIDDKNNHYVDALEFATIKVPFDLEKMKLEDYIKPGQRIVADLKRKKNNVVLNEKQKFVRAMNPLNFTNDRYQEDRQLEDEEYSDIIRKLSGI